MIDEPDPITLLEAMATTLSDQVVPACTDGAQHSARVVANLCRILARELADGAAGHERLHRWAGHQAPYEDLVAELDALIAESTDRSELDAALQILLADTAERAEIAKPGYTDHEPA